jgi:hypothetical protein
LIATKIGTILNTSRSKILILIDANLSPRLSRYTRMLVAIALANKMARSIWAMLTRGENYRNPMMAAA